MQLDVYNAVALRSAFGYSKNWVNLKFSDNYTDIPYWWDAAPRPNLTEVDLVREVDVAIVGSGYTGLHAALQTARAGRSTLVLEAKKAGYGCSSRNGGQVGTSFKPSFKSLARRFGSSKAIAMLQEGKNALQYIKEFIRDEQLDCDWTESGRLLGIHSQRAFRQQEKTHSSLPKEIAVEYHMVPNSELHSEIGSSIFYGGCVLPEHGALHPGKYHLETMERVRQSGAMIVDQCPVQSIERTSSGFRIFTARGNVDAKDVVLATNGYTENNFSWFANRIFPIGSFQIATEPLPSDTISQLIPNNRVISDTRLIGNYFRLSPDRTRLIFGGRVTFTEAASKSGVEELYRQMVRVYPQLESVQVAFSWVGYVAYTMKIVPNVGQHDGIYYSMGYCGSGISLSSYFGMKVGQKVLGKPEGQTGLDGMKFQSWPGIVRNSATLSATTNTLRVFERFL